MNNAPFSLETQFLAEDASEDKIDLEISNWLLFGIDPKNVHVFKSRMGSPRRGLEELAWAPKGVPCQYGSFFCVPHQKGVNSSRLFIRKQALINPISQERKERPLCGGYCRIDESPALFPITKQRYHRMKLTLALNLQRFIRHQPQKDDPRRPMSPTVRKRGEDRSWHGDEFAFDGEDNWLPTNASWQKFATRNHLSKYLELVTDQIAEEARRALCFEGIGEVEDEWGMRPQGLDTELQNWHLKKVETLWEFPSDNPIGDVWEIGSMLSPLPKTTAGAKMKGFDLMKTGRVLNSPCFEFTLAEGVRLKLYAKTNRRIRFEIVQDNLRKCRSQLQVEAGLPPGIPPSTAYQVTQLMKAIRARATKHMNDLMELLRKSRPKRTTSFPVVKLVSEVSAAVSAISHKDRMARIQTLLICLCYFRGYRGKCSGPFADSLAKLAGRGVLKYDRSRQFYALTDSYTRAASYLVSAAEDPLLHIFGTDNYAMMKDGKTPVRLRE